MFELPIKHLQFLNSESATDRSGLQSKVETLVWRTCKIIEGTHKSNGSELCTLYISHIYISQKWTCLFLALNSSYFINGINHITPWTMSHHYIMTLYWLSLCYTVKKIDDPQVILIPVSVYWSVPLSLRLEISVAKTF